MAEKPKSPRSTRPKQLPKPRDFGLLLWQLLYRVPVDTELTEAIVEATRSHCGMKPERLAELRTGPLAIHWQRMEEKRARRLTFFRTFGSVPAGWTPLAPGEQDRTPQIEAMRRWWKTVAPRRARTRKSRKSTDERFVKWLETKLARSRNIKNPAKRMRALNAIEARFMERFLGDRLTEEQFEVLDEVQAQDQ